MSRGLKALDAGFAHREAEGRCVNGLWNERRELAAELGETMEEVELTKVTLNHLVRCQKDRNGRIYDFQDMRADLPELSCLPMDLWEELEQAYGLRAACKDLEKKLQDVDQDMNECFRGIDEFAKVGVKDALQNVEAPGQGSSLQSAQNTPEALKVHFVALSKQPARREEIAQELGEMATRQAESGSTLNHIAEEALVKANVLCPELRRNNPVQRGGGASNAERGEGEQQGRIQDQPVDRTIDRDEQQPNQLDGAMLAELAQAVTDSRKRIRVCEDNLEGARFMAVPGADPADEDGYGAARA